MKHPYADILIAIANNETVQISYDYGKTWPVTKVEIVLSKIASDDQAVQFRIKPKTILINGYEVPEPMKVKPTSSNTYYYPSLGIFTESLYNYSHWTNDVLDNERFYSGLIHSTKEAAIKHAEALISFTKVKE